MLLWIRVDRARPVERAPSSNQHLHATFVFSVFVLLWRQRKRMLRVEGGSTRPHVSCVIRCLVVGVGWGGGGGGGCLSIFPTASAFLPNPKSSFQARKGCCLGVNHAKLVSSLPRTSQGTVRVLSSSRNRSDYYPLESYLASSKLPCPPTHPEPCIIRAP